MKGGRMGRWFSVTLASQVFCGAVAGQAPPLGEVNIIGTGPTTLLMIPCASCRWRSFDEFAERNSDRYTTVAVTLPGYGGSEVPNLPKFGSDLAWHDHALAALEGTLDGNDLKDVIVVGHSFGASIALQLAVRRPDRIKGLINLDGSLVGPLDRMDRSIEERVHAAEEIRSQYMEPLEELDAWQRFNMPAIDRADRRLLYHGWFMDTELTVVQQYWWDNLLVDRNALLQQLALPVLDVQLYGSRSASSAASRSRYEEGASALGLGDNYRVVFHYGVGHFLMEDAPELLDEIIAGFVALGSRIQR